MKKLLFSILSIVLAATFLPVCAYADTSQEAEISTYVEQSEKVAKCKSLVFEKMCIVAIKTEKFLNKSEFDQFKVNLSRELGEKFDLEYVVVTRSPKAMHAIEKISELSENEREEAIKDLIKKLTSKRPDRPAIQPNCHS